MTTTELTELQKQMNTLAEVKCGDCHFRGVRVEFADDCHACNGSGLKREYDVLRLECPGYAVQLGAKTCSICGERRWHVLPAERAHEAVGKLLLTSQFDLQYLFQGDESPPLWTVNYWEKEIPYMSSDTPEEALMAALCEAEGLRDG